MRSNKTQELFDYLVTATESDTIHWRYADVGEELTVIFRKRFRISLDETALVLREGRRELMRIAAGDDSRVSKLFNMARENLS